MTEKQKKLTIELGGTACPSMPGVPFDGQHRIDKKKELSDFMSELSEKYYSAGWIRDWEYTLWKELDVTARHLMPEEVTRLRQLRLELGGWFRFSADTDEDLLFEDTETFAARYVLWKAKHA